MIGVEDVSSICYLADLHDRLGIEGSAWASTIALAMECYEKGLLTEKEVGFPLKWGDAKAVEELLRMTARREGFGDILARGVKKLGDTIGGDAPKFAVHTKGGPINLHDWKSGNWGVWFANIINTGSGWGPSGDFVRSDDFFPHMELRTHERKPLETRVTGMKKYWTDAIGVCFFVMVWTPGTLKCSSDAMSAITGWNFNEDEAMMVGERMMNLERVFNVRLGLTPEDDYGTGVSARLIETPTDGLSKGKGLAPYLKGMVLEYYRLMGWDEKTGKPLRETLERLGLEDSVHYMWA
jgi:aldehyde:ferredoxin oxidoreductase